MSQNPFEVMRRREQADTGMALLAGGRVAEAEARFKALLTDEAGNPEALHGLACVALASGKAALAIGLAGRALNDGNLSEAQRGRFYLTLAQGLADEHHLEPARAALHVSILLQPLNPRAHLLMGTILAGLGRLDDSLIALSEALRLAPDDLSCMQALGAQLMRAERKAEAVGVFQDIVARRPDLAAAWANLGAALFECGAFEEAYAALLRAVETSDDVAAETLNNLGLVEMARGHLLAAGRAFEDAARRAPDDLRVRNNHATLLSELGEAKRASASLRDIMITNAGEEAVRAEFNHAALLLGQGRMAEGWAAFQSRSAFVPLAPETWDGQPTDRPVTIHAEQGLGDIVQFLRYLPMAAERAPLRVCLPDAAGKLLALMPSLANLPPGRVQVASASEEGLSANLLSLPFLLHCHDAPDPAPYFVVDVAPVRGRIGIMWSGSRHYRFDRRRSLTRAQIAPVFDVPGIEFLCLQKDVSDADLAGMVHADMSDLAATARAVASCELIIGVDSVVVHLAGALGRPAWLLNRYGGDWRWRGPSWYESITMFQATTPDVPDIAWPPVVARVVEALRADVSGGVLASKRG